jgi:SMI1 / KNR4 family (SUKH-1)
MARIDKNVVQGGFEALLQRMHSSQIAKTSDLRGCSEAEIAALEHKYQLQLPLSYRRYLQLMGHHSGRLFSSDHIAVFYPYVLNMTEELQQWRSPDYEVPANFSLPDGSLLIAGRLGEQFEFIRCGEQEDSVHYFNTWNWQIRCSYPSVLAWLEAWCGYAEEAIASGYFAQHPLGTGP